MQTIFPQFPKLNLKIAKTNPLKYICHLDFYKNQIICLKNVRSVIFVDCIICIDNEVESTPITDQTDFMDISFKRLRVNIFYSYEFSFNNLISVAIKLPLYAGTVCM